MVKHFVKKLERTFLLGFKALLFVVLFVIFFGLFGLVEPELFRFSRTAGISMSTFVIAGLCLIKIYGGFAIGIKKNQGNRLFCVPSHFITDVISYFELSIMRINFPNQNFWHDLFALVGIVILQTVMINIFCLAGQLLVL